MLNRNDYEKYEYYLKRKNKLWGKNLDQYNEEVKNLNESYGDYFKTIEEIDYIMENKKSIPEIIIQIMGIISCELLLYIMFIRTNDKIINLDLASCVIIILFSNIGLFIVFKEILKSIKYIVKYNKMMKE